jgi:hypothetical protein
MAKYAGLDCDTKRRRKANGTGASTGESKTGSFTAFNKYALAAHVRICAQWHSVKKRTYSVKNLSMRNLGCLYEFVFKPLNVISPRIPLMCGLF